MDPTVQALVMGIVQGLTEFLPISSSGHLILVPWLFGWDDRFISSLAFTVALHIATLGALLVYFRSDWLRLIGAGLASLRERRVGGDPDRRLAWVLVVATIPAGLIGALLADPVEEATRRPAIVAVALIVGAGILWLADRIGRHDRGLEAVGFGGAFGIGLAQAAALVPGISRSGITISAALLLGLDREAAARFSFLLAAPTIAGAGLFEAYRLVRGAETTQAEPLALLIGLVAALLTGLLTIHLLLAWFRRRGVGIFVLYRVALAALVIVLLLRV